VHPGTASRALDPARPGRISSATVERVRAAAAELGYRPDFAARSLRTRRSGTIGLVVPDLTNPVIPPIVRGAEEALWAAGLACLLADTDNDQAREAVLIEELRARRCEGLIVASATRGSEAVEALAREDVAAVLVTRGIDSGALPLVAADDAAGVHAVVEHLVALGHERIAHVTGPRELSTTERRLRAFREALAGAGAPVVHGEAFTIAAGERAAAALLRAHPDVTAIVAGNDMIALGCYAALAAAGRRCPDDVSVTGHNDMPFVAQAQPPLTTVAIPARELGAEAARVLLARLRGEDVPARVLLPTRLIPRGSTAAPAGVAA
jgi:LacI family transcriptional regulator, galactose operon repressor